MQYHISHTRERIPLERDWSVQSDLLLYLIVFRSLHIYATEDSYFAHVLVCDYESLPIIVSH